MADEGRLEEELASFRREWRQEIQRTANDSGSSRNSPTSEPASQPSREGSPNPLLFTKKNSVNAAQQLEEKATQLFLQGVSAERSGNPYEAIYFYRQAVQLVPDIEFRIKDFANHTCNLTSDNSEEEDGISPDPHDMSHLADLTNRFHSLSVTGICQPHYETRMTHISALPLELIMYIFKWVVSVELDMKSLEQLGRVCKGFYACVRDQDIWKLACLRVWGVNCGSAVQWNGSWRLMYIKRPHLLFVGVYISKTSYVRQGERNLDLCYRPIHLVEYYRYMRFFIDGTVVIHTSADEPVTAIPRLKFKQGGNPSVSMGHYRLSGDKVIIVVHKKVMADSHNQSRGRRSKGPPSPILEQELQINRTGHRHHNQLTWMHYTVNTTYRSSGQTVCSQFDLNNQFPPLYFSAVRSFSNNAIAPVE
ncbi:hypothetical protein ACROYT_G032457 [Oculina patagonica]